MSLINEALKKAQRSRTDGAAPASPGTDASGQVVKRAEPRSAKSTLLIISGAILLVVVSMVATAWWLNQPAHPATETKAKPVPIPASVATENNSGAPHVVMPPITPAAAPNASAAVVENPQKPSASPQPPSTEVASSAVPATPTPAPSLSSNTAKPAVPAEPAAVVATTEAASSTPPATEPATPSTAKPDERIHQFIEALRVTGIRASGTDSKVLMNDRVYRVNDIVDRNLGVRLTKVSAESLTFTDANGVTYVKYF